MGVAISAGHAKLAHMELVRKRHGLCWLVTDTSIFGREVVPNEGHKAYDQQSGRDGDHTQPTVGVTRKDGVRRIGFGHALVVLCQYF